MSILTRKDKIKNKILADGKNTYFLVFDAYATDLELPLKYYQRVLKTNQKHEILINLKRKLDPKEILRNSSLLRLRPDLPKIQNVLMFLHLTVDEIKEAMKDRIKDK